MMTHTIPPAGLAPASPIPRTSAILGSPVIEVTAPSLRSASIDWPGFDCQRDLWTMVWFCHDAPSRSFHHADTAGFIVHRPRAATTSLLVNASTLSWRSL